MRLLRAAHAVWGFVVGDDWIAGLGLIVGLGVTALIADAGLPAWWLMPLTVLSLLGASLWRCARRAAKEGS